MSFSRKSYKCGILALAVGAAAVACTQPRYAYHSVYKLSSCGKQITRDAIAESLVRKGYLHASDHKGPYDIFHKPEIATKGPLAAERYEDRAGDIAVAVCGGSGESYLMTEEWRGCKDKKDCTAENQRDVKRLAEEWGCQVSEKAGHSESWKLEERQDWTKDSCALIATSITF
jgi:hypothetical protein